jgi:hypothetical protein
MRRIYLVTGSEDNNPQAFGSAAAALLCAARYAGTAKEITLYPIEGGVFDKTSDFQAAVKHIRAYAKTYIGCAAEAESSARGLSAKVHVLEVR